ncbi:MAG: prepilin-type N-terminal cleavage/methylation domain-containing protein [Candidatus Aminicenantes bacterium]|nr:MAG: prepilin-type N-terminal cleavage/methylation domain-containing protein [Candidatus Aminicenantes bacterium]
MKRKGFTLIELLIVIAIIGIVAAIAIPNLLTALQKGKQKATMGDMKSIGNAVESYMTDLYMAPGAGGVNVISGLNNFLAPFYIKILPLRDGWGGEFRYQSGVLGPDQDLYSVISYGRGNVSTGIDITNSPYIVTTMTGFENDIVYSNGNFTYAPKVK